ncbi:serine/threonine-protein kinase CDL1-like [Cucumis melo var. makuwa]|uniref:non-specific serine/threonine protein kinase n=1 Tax=Cucumis melo var. makuwa TaxID=1194695 RepID=A0A5D3CM49_CUCMM|nr:serine/threonine-protein kinase CDL1-like [Cucumis melo var. makuwa]
MATFSVSSPAVSPPPSRSNRWVEYVVGVGVVASLGALLFCVFRGRIMRKLREGRGGSRKGSVKEEKLLKLRRFEFEELGKATKNFSREYLLGAGSFANVYKGVLESEGEIVAIKRPHADSYTSLDEFRNEVKLLSSVKHKNLVALVGYCEETTGNVRERILVYEYVPNGSLLDYMIGRGGRSLTWRQRVNIAIGAAKGIGHLHKGMKASIIHRDVKPSNILIGDGMEPKVCDFGLVRSGPVGDRSHVSSQIKGTPGYLDPAYCSTFHLTPFSDVYSFGIILLQLVSARPVLASNRPIPDSHIVQWAGPSLEKGRVEEILDADLLTESCNFEVMLKMGQLGLKCTSQQPKYRPTMAQVWQELEEALHGADNFWKRKQLMQNSMEIEYSESLASTEGIRFGKFRVGMDSFAFESASLKCLEINSVSIDIDHSTEKQLSAAANDEQNKD